MDWRTIGALLGVCCIAGGIFTLFGHIGHTDRNSVAEIAKPSRPARESISRHDPMMDPYMGGGMGMPMDPFIGGGGMGMPMRGNYPSEGMDFPPSPPLPPPPNF